QTFGRKRSVRMGLAAVPPGERRAGAVTRAVRHGGPSRAGRPALSVDPGQRESDVCRRPGSAAAARIPVCGSGESATPRVELPLEDPAVMLDVDAVELGPARDGVAELAIAEPFVPGPRALVLLHHHAAERVQAARACDLFHVGVEP